MLTTFIDDVCAGKALLEDVDAYVERWHNGHGENITLREYLGLDVPQYVAFMKDPASLKEAVPRMTVPGLLPRVHAYRNLPENGVGGSLHIVLDDGNIRDSDLRFCLDYALTKGDTEGAALARLLLGMTKTQRKKVHALFYH